MFKGIVNPTIDSCCIIIYLSLIQWLSPGIIRITWGTVLSRHFRIGVESEEYFKKAS